MNFQAFFILLKPHSESPDVTCRCLRYFSYALQPGTPSNKNRYIKMNHPG